MNTSPLYQTTNIFSKVIIMIENLLSSNPLQGLFIITTSLLIFASILVLTTWMIVKIIKANKVLPKPIGDIFDKEKHALNILELTKQILTFNTERDLLSRCQERILEHVIVRDQMAVAESTIDHIKSILLIKISDLIRSKELSNPLDSPIYHSYSFIISHTLDEITKIYRRMAKENHLAEKSDQEFFKYYSKKLEFIKTFGSQVLESNYYNNQAIPINDIVKVYNNQWSEFKLLYERIFIDMKDISIKYEIQIKTEEEAYNKRWSKFVSSIPNLLLSGIIKK